MSATTAEESIPPDRSASSSSIASASEPVKGLARQVSATSRNDQYGCGGGSASFGSDTVRMCPGGSLMARWKMLFGAGTYRYRKYDASAARSIERSKEGPASSA